MRGVCSGTTRGFSMGATRGFGDDEFDLIGTANDRGRPSGTCTPLSLFVVTVVACVSVSCVSSLPLISSNNTNAIQS